MTSVEKAFKRWARQVSPHCLPTRLRKKKPYIYPVAFDPGEGIEMTATSVVEIDMNGGMRVIETVKEELKDAPNPV